MNTSAIPAAVRQAFLLSPEPATPITHGHINQTFETLRAGERVIIQRLHPVFDGAVNDNIAVLGQHLKSLGKLCPQLLETEHGARFFKHDDTIWRGLSFIDGKTLHRLEDPTQAAEAARALVHFHLDVKELKNTLVQTRPPIHQPQRHFEALSQALKEYSEHSHKSRLLAALKPLDALKTKWLDFEAGESSVVHGDPKITNLLFDDQNHALCWIDLDTLGVMPILAEWGDALRSWCNAHTEDDPQATFSFKIFNAVLEGAQSVGDFRYSKEELLRATLTIACELACRFARDVLKEEYFSFDSKRFERSADHQLQRVLAQLSLAASIEEHL